jgi:nucleoid-associated protein YgaU
VAERVLKSQGIGAWPGCGKKGKQATIKVKTVSKAMSTATADSRHYIVRSGDTLSSIATKQSVSGGWSALYRLNKAMIGADPNRIRVGLRLAL